MKVARVLEKWKAASQEAFFFESFQKWTETASDKPVRTQEQEYDRLLKYTEADVCIPLWASLCKNPEGTLMDSTTLEILQFYHRWGYQCVEMDGNPPDYIGQMFRFLGYLYAGALHICLKEESAALENGSSTECLSSRKDQEILSGQALEMLAEADRFCSLYVMDTVRSIAKDIERYTTEDIFLRMAEELKDSVQLLLSGAEENGESESQNGIAESCQKADDLADIDFHPENLICCETFLKGKNDAIAEQNQEIIYTGGRNNCGGKCSIRTTVQEGCLLGLETGCHLGQPGLRACVRGQGYRKTYLSGERLRYPLKRVGKRGEGKFRRISWEEAEDLIAAEWIRIRDKYGPGARYVNYGLGLNAIIRPDMLIKRLLNEDGGFLDFYGSYSFACAQFTTPYIYGDANSGNSIEDLPNTRLLILWAHNPAETVYSPQGNYMIEKAKENGAKVIVIDPRKSDTVIALADQWIPIRPGTDAALASAMAYVIWQEGRQNQSFMDRYCLGFDAEHMPEGVQAELNYHAYIFGESDGIPKTPEWAEQITGIPADTISTLAREYADAKPACILPGLGNQRTANGEQNVRAMAALCCLTGNVGIPGGGAGGTGFTAEEARPVYPMGTNNYGAKISCFLWTDAILRGREMTTEADGVQGKEQLEADIHMMFNLGSNTLINQHADVNRSARILEDESLVEFLVCSDVFMTPSARFADLLLPAPSFLEDNNMAAPWRMGHYLLSNNKVIQPLFGCRTEYAWIGEVAGRLGLWERWSMGRTSQEEWLESLYGELRGKYPEMPSYETFKKDGGYTWKDAKPFIAYEEQIKDPETHPFKTPSGKIEIFSERLYNKKNPDRIPAVPAYVAPPEGPDDPLREKYPLQLIGWHTKRRCHSIHDNNPWMEEIEPQRVWIHPEDAAARGIQDEMLTEVFNDRGRVRIQARVTDRIMQGVIAIPEGAWYTPGKDGIDRRGNINVLTSSEPTPLAKGNGQHTCLAEIQRYEEKL